MATHSATDTIDQFSSAISAHSFKAAERSARRLAPHDQLLVVDSLRAAEARLKKAGIL